MAPKPSNKHTNTNIDYVDIDLTLYEDENRTWVDKYKFPEFNDGYNGSQENSALSNSSQVQFRKTTQWKTLLPKKKNNNCIC